MTKAAGETLPAPPSRKHLPQSSTRYEMFASSLVADIAAGKYPVGSLLPPEPELCVHYGLSRHTVREGVRRLVEMGLVSRQQGIGTRVISADVAPNRFSAATSLEALFSYVNGTWLRIVSERWVTADKELAQMLDCKVGQRWLEVNSYRYRKDEDTPLSQTVLYIPPAFEGIRPHLSELDHPVYQLIEEHYGQTVQDLQMVVRAVSIRADVASELRCRPNSPGLMVVRRYRGANGAELSASISTYPQSRFEVAIRYRLNWANG